MDSIFYSQSSLRSKGRRAHHKRSAILISLFALGALLASCSQASYTSRDSKLNEGNQASTQVGRIAEYSFAGGESAIINGKEMRINVEDSTDLANLVPSLQFCSDDSCLDSDSWESAEKLGIHYKPRYRSADDEFYSCPSPVPGYDYSGSWFDTAVQDGLCIQENKETLFHSPVSYVVTAPDGSEYHYTLKVQSLPSNANSITYFAFLEENNPALPEDVEDETISASPIELDVPFGTDLTELVPSFWITGKEVQVGGEVQISSRSKQNFSNTVTYSVTEIDGGGSQDYAVDVTEERPLSDFKLEKGRNPQLTASYTGSIDHDNGIVTFVIPDSEDVTNLFPSIELSHESIQVTPSTESGQDFSSGDLQYTFKAKSGKEVSYGVNVTTGLAAGDLVITEVMSNTDNISDTDGEYLELYNSTDSIIDLNVQPITLSDDGGDFTTISSGSIAANDYFLICRNADSGANGGITECDHEPSSMSLTSAETITVKQGAVTLDTFGYTSETAGVSWELATNKYSSDNSDETFWGPATSNYHTNNKGTPGAANDYVYSPPLQSGDLIITEVMADPDAVGDSNGEYLELYNPTGSTIDFTSNQVEFTAGLSGTLNSGSIAAGQYFLLCVDTDSGTNGGMNNCDAAFPGGSLTNSGETITIEEGSNVIDTFTYTTATTGKSFELADNKLTEDNSGMTNWGDAVNTYGDGDYGTPGEENDYTN